MGFKIPELIVESIIRDGIQNILDNPAIIDDLFKELTRGYAARKYGAAELQKIKDLLQRKEETGIPIVYSFQESDGKDFCYSIQISNETEDARRAHLGDFYDEVQEDIVDSAELAALVRVSNITVLSYNSVTGKVTVDDATDLSQAYAGLIFVDADDNEYQVKRGISNITGDKCFFIEEALDVVDISGPCLLKSPLDYKQYEVSGITEDVNIIVGVHSKDALKSKYLYVLLKYFLMSRKKDMIKRGLVVAKISGTDFSRDLQLQGDYGYVRFLTLSAKVDHTWRGDQVQLIDHVEVIPVPVE